VIRFPILLVLASCAAVQQGPEFCVTRCGLVAQDGDCKLLGAYEGQVIRRLEDEIPAWKASATCDGLRGFAIKIRPYDAADGWCSRGTWHEGGHCYYGLTNFRKKTITLENASWRNDALAHEIAHLADLANGTMGNGAHCAWSNAALPTLLRELSSEPEASTPEPSCKP
jgi:hypothetical protein